MEDNRESMGTEYDRKPIFDSRSCPQCGNRVSWKRLQFKTFIWSKWECPICGSLLGVDFGRRIVIGFTVVPLALLPLVFFGVRSRYFQLAWVVLVCLYIFSFERIKILRSGPERGGQHLMKSTP
jgi:hypothetical protein